MNQPTPSLPALRAGTGPLGAGPAGFYNQLYDFHDCASQAALHERHLVTTAIGSAFTCQYFPEPHNFRDSKSAGTPASRRDRSTSSLDTRRPLFRSQEIPLLRGRKPGRLFAIPRTWRDLAGALFAASQQTLFAHDWVDLTKPLARLMTGVPTSIQEAGHPEPATEPPGCSTAPGIMAVSLTAGSTLEAVARAVLDG